MRFLDGIGGGSVVVRAFDVRDGAGSAHAIFLTATVLYHLPGALTRATSGVVPVNFGALSRLGEFRATLADDISMTAAVDSPGQFGVTVASIGGGRFAAYFRSALTIGGRHTLQIVVGDSGGRYAPFRAAFTAEAARGEVIVLGASDNGRQVWVAADNNLQDWHKRKSFSAAQTGGGRMVNFNGTLVAAITIDNNNLNISYSPDRGKSWIKTAQNFSPRTGFGMAVHNGAIYIIGGSGRDYLLRDVWRSINIRDWQKLPAPGLDAMADFPLISHNGSLIIPGGRQNYGDDSSRRVYSADRNFWQRDVAGGDAPRVGRFDKHAAAVYNGKVYIYGLDDSVYAFDTADNWLSCGRTFARRAGAQALVFAGRVHLFGGGTRTIARMNGCPPVEASPGQTPPDTEQGAPAVYLPFAPPDIIAPPPPLLQVSVNATAPLTITAGGLATVNLLTMHLRGGTPPFAYSVVAPYLTISGNVVMLAGAPPVATTAAISVRITDRDLLPSTIFAVFTLAAVSPPPVSIDIISQTPVLVVGESAQTILISASGGFVGDGDYRIIGNDTTVFAAAGSIAAIKISAAQTGALTLTLSANDNHNDTPAASALLILPIVAPLRLSAAYQLISVIATLSPPRAHNRLAESGGFGARRLSLINPPFGFVLDGKVISITAILQTITTLTLTAAVADSNNPPRRATTTIPVIVAPLAPFGARLLIDKGILPSNENVALVQPFGGVEDYIFRTDGAVANINRSGEVYFHLPRGGGLSVITAVITVNDSYHSEETPPVYLTLTATIAPRLPADVDGNENIRAVSANHWTPIGTIEVDKDSVGSLTAASSPFGLARGEDLGLNSDNDRQMRIWAGPATAGLYTILLTTADRAGRYAPSTSRWTISAQAQTGAITLKPPMRGRFLPQRIMTITAMLNITILLATMTIEGGLQPISFSVYGVPPRHPDFATTRFPDWLAIDSDGVISVFKAVLNTMLLDGERGWAMTARATDALGQMVQSAFTIHVIPKNDFVAALENTTPIIAAGSYANVATVSISGGHIAEDYRLRFFGGGDAAYRIGGRVVAVSAASPGVITATVIADDDIARYAPITILLTLTALPPLQIDMDKVSIVITVPSSLPAGAPLLTAIASGGKPPYSYRIDWSSGESPMAVGDDGIISLAAYLRYSDSQKVSPLFWNLQVRDSSGYLRATKRRLRFAYSAADISISQTRVGDGVIAVGNTFATVAQLAASGGYLKNSREKYVFSLVTVIGASISARVNDDGKVSARAISAGTATAVVIADDRHNSSKPATTRIIITAADASNFTAAISGVKGSIFASVPVAVATLSVSGGYLAAGGTYDLRGAASHGAISFGGAQPSGFAITLLAPSAGLITATIIADDNHLSSPPKTLLLTTRAIHGASIIVPDDLADGVIVVAVDYRNLRVILTATGGIENYRFSLINNRADLSLRQPRRGMDKGFEQNGNILSMLFTRHREVKSYTISISLTDGNSASAPAHLKTTMTFIFTLSVVPRNSAATTPVFPDSPPVMQTPPLSSASHPILKLAYRTSGGNPFFNHPLPPYHPRKRQSAAAITSSSHKR